MAPIYRIPSTVCTITGGFITFQVSAACSASYSCSVTMLMGADSAMALIYRIPSTSKSLKRSKGALSSNIFQGPRTSGSRKQIPETSDVRI
ncbi:hypothetical protein J6590_061031 [Homalodisca vitripennis]|nr:hypothetical protein J6590_061031 [Homalodisca vitripennis]